MYSSEILLKYSFLFQNGFHVAALFENVPKMLRMPEEEGEESLYACLASRDVTSDVRFRHDINSVRAEAGLPVMEPITLRRSELSAQLRSLLAKIEGNEPEVEEKDSARHETTGKRKVGSSTNN